MLYKFMGARKYDFLPEGEKERKTGVSIFVTEPVKPEFGVGEVPVKLNVSVDVWQEMNATGQFTNGVGKMVDVQFDRFGKPLEIRFQAGK